MDCQSETTSCIQNSLLFVEGNLKKSLDFTKPVLKKLLLERVSSRKSNEDSNCFSVSQKMKIQFLNKN